MGAVGRVQSGVLDLTAMGCSIGVGSPDTFALGIAGISKPSTMTRSDYKIIKNGDTRICVLL